MDSSSLLVPFLSNRWNEEKEDEEEAERFSFRSWERLARHGRL